MSEARGAKIGVEAVLEDKQFQQSYKRVEASLQRIEKHTQRMANNSVRAHNRVARTVQRSSNNQIASMIRLRRQIMTITFFVRLAAGIVTGAYNEMAEGAENAAERMGGRALAREAEVNLGPLVRTLVEVSEGALSAQQAFELSNAAILEDQGRFVEQYDELWQAARVAAVTGGGEAIEIHTALVKSMREGTGEAADQATGIFNVQAALQEYAASMDTTADQLTHGEAAAVTFNTVMERTEELLASGAGAALDEAGAFERLSASWEDFKNVSTAVIQTTGLIDSVTKAIQSLTKSMIILGGTMSAGIYNIRKQAESDLPIVHKLWNMITGGGADQADVDRFREEAQRRGLEALGFFEDVVDPSKREYQEPYEVKPPNIEPIIKQLIKREELFEKHDEKIDQIQLKHLQRLEDIELRHANNVRRIEHGALRSRERAYRAHALSVEDATIKHISKIADLQTRHELKVAQRTRKFQIDQLQSERMYQYERTLLVAEGDVLGIEDLDARYLLEKQKDEENFADQQTAQQETHDQRMAREEEEFRERMDQLLRHLNAQIDEINIREQDQLDEADRRRQEARDKAAQDLAQQLEAELMRHEKSLEQWNQYWNQVAKQAKIGLEQVTAIIEEFFGPSGEAAGIMDDYIERFSLRSDITARVTPIVGAGVGGGGGDRPWEDIPVGHQYGGQGIVSTPTLFRAGEGGTPERYSFEPMTTIGQSMTLSWAGGAIPIQGSGGMEGADLSGVGDGIVQGLLIAITSAMQRG